MKRTAHRVGCEVFSEINGMTAYREREFYALMAGKKYCLKEI